MVLSLELDMQEDLLVTVYLMTRSRMGRGEIVTLKQKINDLNS